jgi:hypothetical protein
VCIFPQKVPLNGRLETRGLSLPLGNLGMARNIQVVSRKPFYRVPIPGVRLGGWALRYVSGMENVAGAESIKPGHWMTEWHVGPNGGTFNFEPELIMCFDNEADAKAVSETLWNESEIKSEVVKI